MSFAGKQRGGDHRDGRTRVAVVDAERCKPSRCAQECRKACPVERQGKECVRVVDGKARVVEAACVGCNLCTKRCPFGAIRIVNIPRAMAANLTHRYGANGFSLHRLPLPRRGQVLGLLGANGTGKSTALRVLAGSLKPNFGRTATVRRLADMEDLAGARPPAAAAAAAPGWDEVVRAYRGSELQNYFRAVAEGALRAAEKPQHVDLLPAGLPAGATVAGLLAAAAERPEAAAAAQAELLVAPLLPKRVAELSGGELQRVAIAAACGRAAEVYVFDEPSSFLDARQRAAAVRAIRAVAAAEHRPYVVVVEHDLCVLDAAADSVCVLYGDAGAYGAVAPPGGSARSINSFLRGEVPGENVRFRDEALAFRFGDRSCGAATDASCTLAEYPAAEVRRGGFTLAASAGAVQRGEVVALLGENGTGKTTFLHLLAGTSAEGCTATFRGDAPRLRVSLKPQQLRATFPGSVRELLQGRVGARLSHAAFRSDVVEPLRVGDLLDKAVRQLSGGEMQRVALVLALGKPADVFLIDEPSAHLDAEMRLAAARALRRFIRHTSACCLVVEHDLLLAAYVADRAVVFAGEPGAAAAASAPVPASEGMNMFLRGLGVTMRTDRESGRPRVNKLGGVTDREQRARGEYFATGAPDVADRG